MQPYPLAQRCGRPSQLTECNTSSLVSHGNSGTSQQVSLLLCNRPVRECASPGSPPLLCCCAPRCDLGERAGSRAHGPGVHRRGSVRTKAKAASISHLTSCAQKTATVLRENVTSFLFKYSTLALQIIRFCKYDFRRFNLCFWCCCGFRADMQSAAWKEFGCPASSLAQHNWSLRTKQHRHAAF